MDSDRWRPPLPSLGRMGGAPVRSTLVKGCLTREQAHVRDTLNSRPLLLKLKEYFTERRSVSDLFETRVAPTYLVRCGMPRQEPRYLSEFSHSEQCHLLLSSLYFKASDNFKMKLRISLQKRNGLSRVRQWWHTANAVVLPLLISQGEDLKAIDHLTRWCLENCANNYAQFLRSLKLLKKRLRKAFATNKGCCVERSMRPYQTYFSRKSEFSSPQEWGRYVLLWTQTRACGLADHVMIRDSIDKWVDTVSTPSRRIRLNPQILEETVHGALGVDGKHARISVGSTACLENTRQNGGKSSFMASLCKRPVLDTIYDPISLQPTEIVARPVSCSRDVLYWATQSVLRYPTHSRMVRLHAVAEPGKARTITVAPYAYQVLMGTFAHVFQATLKSKGVASGLTRDRHLWRFLSDTMNPQSTMWGHLSSGKVYGLSTDWSEATDYGDPYVARQVWHALITLASSHPKFPKGLAVLAMNLYCGKRYACVPVKGGYRLVITNRGWFMGDMMTKSILTIVHDYTMRLYGLKVYSLVGDDEVVLSNDPGRLRAHLSGTEALDLKISREDTFISTRLIFYCEEGALVPQKPTDALHVAMRRNNKIGYLDYPRLRLLLAESSETDNYSMTNIGRFTLLGKESRWVQAVNESASETFQVASLLQHILVPQDSDTLCPFIPLEIGGDGAYINDAHFVRRVVDDKARDPREVLYRMESLMNSTFSYKFVRSERHNEVVHKHHLLLPALEELKHFLPQEAVLTPKDATQRTLIESIRVRGIESPQATWLRLCRGFYYKKVFNGETPIEPKFDIVRSYSSGHTEDPYVDVWEFLRHWANPGFRFANKEPFFVVRDLVETMDPLSLNWEWSDFDLLRYPSAFSVFNNWLREDVDLLHSSFDDIYNLIVRGAPLPDRIVKRLNLFMESDSYILSTLPREYRSNFYIVTRDFRLCAEIRKRLLAFSDGKLNCWIWALDPNVYLTGGVVPEGNTFRGMPAFVAPESWVEDPGAVLHVDYTEFSDGIPHWDGIWDASVWMRPHRYHTGVVIIQYNSN